MPVWGWILIAIGAIVVAALVIWRISVSRRTSHLRDRFGPEYDRVAEDMDKSEAEAELAHRVERREQFDIKALPEDSKKRYVESWRDVQAQFVDDPKGAIGTADKLLKSVMAERGYPIEDFDQRAADLSVDHPKVVQNYREGHRIAEESKRNGTSTEDLRQALKHYRELFEELVGPTSEQSRAA
jgi:DNA/RNA-binding domain of Phe-tRNA-synthetase-like protein